MHDMSLFPEHTPYVRERNAQREKRIVVARDA